MTLMRKIGGKAKMYLCHMLLVFYQSWVCACVCVCARVSVVCVHKCVFLGIIKDTVTTLTTSVILFSFHICTPNEPLTHLIYR